MPTNPKTIAGITLITWITFVALAVTKKTPLSPDAQFCSLIINNDTQHATCLSDNARGRSIQASAGSNQYANFNQLNVCHAGSSAANTLCLNAVMNGASAQLMHNNMEEGMSITHFYFFITGALTMYLATQLLSALSNTEWYKNTFPQEQYNPLIGNDDLGF
jgi:hypothetical protein